MTTIDIIGMIGVILILITYLLLQIEKMRSDSLSYSIGNAVGALLVILSLIETWNLPSFIIEVVWLMISIYGILKWFIKRNKFNFKF